MKEQLGVKHSTIVRYQELTERIYPAIGHIKLKDLRADHLNSFYLELSKSGAGKGSIRAVSKIDLAAELKEHSLTRAALAEKPNDPKSRFLAYPHIRLYPASKGCCCRYECGFL